MTFKMVADTILNFKNASISGADYGQQLQDGFQPVVERVSDDYNF